MSIDDFTLEEAGKIIESLREENALLKRERASVGASSLAVEALRARRAELVAMLGSEVYEHAIGSGLGRGRYVRAELQWHISEIDSMLQDQARIEALLSWLEGETP